MIGKKKNFTLFTAVVGISVLLVAGYAFKDKAVEQWYIWKLDSEDPGEKFRAGEKLAGIGSSRAVPKFIKFLHSGSVQEKILAVRTLGEMRSIEAVPALLETLRQRAPGRNPRHSTARESFIHPTVREAIVKIGNAAVPGLIELLRDQKGAVRLEAVEVLGEIGPEAVQSIAALTASRKDENPLIRSAAVEALKRIQR